MTLKQLKLIMLGAGVLFMSNFAQANDYAFISDDASNTVTMCNVGTDGSLANCMPLSSNIAFSEPLGLATYQTFLYVATQGGIMACSFLPRTDLKLNCKFTALPDPIINLAVNNQYLYGISVTDNTLYYCPLAQDGEISTCTSQIVGTGITGGDLPFTISFYNNMAYIGGAFDTGTSNPTTVKYCEVNNDGSLNCTGSDNITINNPNEDYDIVTSLVFTNKGYAYLADYNGNVAYCEVNAKDGTLSNCQASAANLYDGQYNAYPFLYYFNNTAYVVAVTDGQQLLATCDTQSNNDLGGCSNPIAYRAGPFDNMMPFGVAFMSVSE